jgi:hypothetical protein
MKKTILIYWPVAMLLPIALAAHLASIDATVSAAPRMQPTAASVSAELARAISFGYVEPEAVVYRSSGAAQVVAPAERAL